MKRFTRRQQTIIKKMVTSAGSYYSHTEITKVGDEVYEDGTPRVRVVVWCLDRPRRYIWEAVEIVHD